jgi:hypothetical protein
LAADGERGFDVQVRLEQVGQSINGELRVTSDSGEADTRTVEGSTCGVVVEALSLTAALALEAAEEKRERQLVAEQQVSASASTPSKTTPREPIESTESSESTENEQSGSDGLDGVHVELGAQAVAARVLAPEVSVGVALVVRIVADPNATLSPSLGVSLTYAGAELADASSEAQVRWLAATFGACPLRLSRGSVVGVRPCVLGSVGQVEAAGNDLTNPQTVRRSWWSAGGALRADARLGEGVAIELEVGVMAPLVERSFVAQPSGRILLESPKIFPLGSVGFVYMF